MVKSLAPLLIGSAFALNAHAATLSFSFNFPSAPTDISETGFLGLFDTSLGSLVGATLQVQGSAVLSFSGTNTSSQTQRVSMTSSTDLFWSSSLAPLNAFLGDSIHLSASSGFQSFAPDVTMSFGPFSLTDTLTDDLGGVLASLQAPGGGGFSISCESLSGLSITGGGGNIASTQSSQASCGASIVYTYQERGPDQVPEPASLALLGIGLAGLGCSRRARR